VTVASMVRSVAIVLSIAISVEASAQANPEARERGITAYRELEFELAITQLHRALELAASAGAPEMSRAELLAYVGAAQVHLRRPSAAARAFQDALRLAPRFRIDTVTFPPAVTEAFEAARRRTAFVAAESAPDTTLVLGEDEASFRIYTSAPVSLRVDVCDAMARCPRLLFQGTVTDSVIVRWNGTGRDHETPLEGALELRVRPAASNGREVSLPMMVTAWSDPVDPSAPAGAPQGSRRGLVTGVLIAAMTAALPSIVSRTERGTDLRLGVSATLLAAAIFGTPLRQPPVASPPSRRWRVVTGDRTVVERSAGEDR
jgi:hypothetical protein